MNQATREFQIVMAPHRARLLSVLVVASLFLGYLGGAAVDDAGPADLAFSVAKLVGLLGAILLFLTNYGQMSQRPEARLDEREAQIRNRAYVLTHQLMVGCLFVAFFWTSLAGKLNLWLPDADGASDLITAFAMSSMALPGAILAWRDRPIADED